MKLCLDADKIQRTIHKNTVTSYGLTLVIGLPFPDEIGKRVEHIQQRVQALAPGRFAWYGLEHLHATLFAPLRGRYRERPTLQREELPSDLESFASDVANLFAQLSPFTLQLAGVYLSQTGVVEVREATPVQRLVSGLHKYPEIDDAKYHPGLHVAIGFLRRVPPFDTDKEQACFAAELDEFTHTPIGPVKVQHIWLVHYANRTLNRIIGRIPLALGRTNTLTAERLLRELGIAAT